MREVTKWSGGKGLAVSCLEADEAGQPQPQGMCVVPAGRSAGVVGEESLEAAAVGSQSGELVSVSRGKGDRIALC